MNTHNLGIRISCRLGMVLLWVSQSAWATDGYSLAARHAVTLTRESSPVIGNGQVGCLLQAPQNTPTFLKGVIQGEHWRVFENENRPAKRIALASFELEIVPCQPDIPGLPPFLKGALYQFSSNQIGNRFLTSQQVLSATWAISPTRNLFLMKGVANFPVHLRWKVCLPEPLLTESETFAATRIVSATYGMVAMTHTLPRLESFGIGLWASGKQIQCETGEYQASFELQHTDSWELRLGITSQQDNTPLLPLTVAETLAWSASPESFFTQERKLWWQTFWDRAVLDLEGSTHPLAPSLERIWISLHHALATQAAGNYPPADRGYGDLSQDGRPWNSVLLPLYRGWILSNHSRDIHCLNYPALLPEEAQVFDCTLSPALLPSECGPDGIPAENTEALVHTLAELNLVTENHPWNETGRLFSTIPLINRIPFYRYGRTESDADIYPYLYRNANRVLEVFSCTDSFRVGTEGSKSFSQEHLPVALFPHLMAVLVSAVDMAQDIQIDAPARRKWQACLQRMNPATTGQSLRIPVDLYAFEPVGASAEWSLQRFHDWVNAAGMAPEGTLLTQAGERSILQTGVALGRLMELLIRETFPGTSNPIPRLTFFPGILLDGSWNVHWQNLGTLQGVIVTSLTVKHGVCDSIVLKTLFKGPLQIDLPQSWSSAQIAELSGAPGLVSVRSIDSQTIEFDCRTDGSYLIGPVW